MAEPVGNLRCILGCWAMAALAGALAAVMLIAVGDLSYTGAIFCGVLLLAILAFILPIILCRPLPTIAEAQARHGKQTSDAHVRAQGAEGSSGTSAGTVAAGTAAAAMGAGAMAASSTGSDGAGSDGAVSGDADIGAQAAALKADADAKAAADRAKADADARAAAERAKADADAKAAADRAKADADAKAAADRAKADADAKAAADRAKADADAKAAAAASSAAASSGGSGDVDYDGDGILEGKDEGTRPAGLDAPRGGKGDNLKEIKGVGPAMEKLCNSLGFWHFDQIASWSADEVAWVDANLEGFKGRVTRDTWVEQAKVLAAGGATEFSKRVEGGDVY